jgi:hypothetical protein
MANEEQVDLLKQGVERWNNWREENPDVILGRVCKLSLVEEAV